MDQKPIIELSGINKEFKVIDQSQGILGALKSLVVPKYKIIKALDNVDLSIYEGEIVGYVGPNGAGKSTTIKMIAGVMKPSSGNVHVFDRDPFENRIAHQLNLGIVIGQRPRLFWELPVIESFLYQTKVYRVAKSDFQHRFENLVQLFSIESLLNQPVRQLSLGQRMRCDIALNLIHCPPILLLDEPTIGLDIDSKIALRKSILSAARELSTTVLLTSHDLNDVEVLASRLVILNEGRILFEGSLEALRIQYKICPVIEIKTEVSLELIKQLLREMNGIESIAQKKNKISISFDQSKISSASILSKVIAQTPIDDFSIEDPPIEELIRTVYTNSFEPAVTS